LEIRIQKDRKGLPFFLFSLFAFAGLGLEVILAFFIEPFFYGKELNDFSTIENILHWIFTCVLWATVTYLLIKLSKNKLDFDVFSFKEKIGWQRWLLCCIFLAVSIVASIISWNGMKVVKEFLYHGWLKFIFQYLYYAFEVGLFLLIIIFAQSAGEIWFKNEKIPWGGILLALTWGIAHIFTKGDLLVGIYSSLGGILYGGVYLICKKNVLLAYPIILLMFIL